jgi:RNA polymerase sigma factor (sigma-70 family)
MQERGRLAPVRYFNQSGTCCVTSCGFSSYREPDSLRVLSRADSFLNPTGLGEVLALIYRVEARKRPSTILIIEQITIARMGAHSRMANLTSKKSKPKRSPYFVAMVLGTALSAAGSAAAVSPVGGQADLRAASDISRYCTACWRNARLNPDCWADCTQEVFCRLLERVSLDCWPRALQCDGDERREFFRAIDAVKKRSQRTRKWTASAADVADYRDARDRRLADDRELVRQMSRQLLTSRQQQILDFSFDGWSVQEIAARLDLTAARVSDEKYKAIRKLRNSLS